MDKDFLILDRDSNGITRYYPKPIKSDKLTITLPIDYGEFRGEEQLHNAREIGIDFGIDNGDTACNVIIKKGKNGLIIRTLNQFHRINVFKIEDRKNEIELRISET